MSASVLICFTELCMYAWIVCTSDTSHHTTWLTLIDSAVWQKIATIFCICKQLGRGGGLRPPHPHFQSAASATSGGSKNAAYKWKTYISRCGLGKALRQIKKGQKSNKAPNAVHGPNLCMHTIWTRSCVHDDNQLFRNGSCTTWQIGKIHNGWNFVSTHLGIPRPSAWLLWLKWASLNENSNGNSQRSVSREFDVFGIFRKVIWGSCLDEFVHL